MTARLDHKRGEERMSSQGSGEAVKRGGIMKRG